MVTNIFKYYDKLRMNKDIYKYIKKTPITNAKYLSKFTNNNVLYKREDLQITSMFNVRGVCMRLLNLSDKNKKNGIAVYGYNNYIKSLIYMSNQLKIKSTIMLPKNVSRSVIHDINKYKSSIFYKHGDNTEELDYNDIYLYDRLRTSLEGLNKKVVFDFYNDNYIIAGNSNIAYEILMDYKNINMIFVPMICGNLAAGILVGIKNLYPKIKVIGVLYNDLTLNDDESNRKVSSMAYEICTTYLDDIIKVDIHDIDNAIEMIYNDTNVVVKPNGALSVSGLYKYTKMNNIQNQNIIAITNNTNYICY